MDITLRDLMTEEEKYNYANFLQRHASCHSSISVTFTPTGLGYQIVCKCCGCKRKQDITDYESW